jgi:YVTN family beta-propeller protein
MHLPALRLLCLVLGLGVCSAALAQAPGDPAPEPPAAAAGAEPAVQRITREGLAVEFAARRELRGADRQELLEGEHVELSFRVMGAQDGAPVRGLYPIAWMDLGEAWAAKDQQPLSCKERVGVYLQGVVGMRPMIDLTSYFVLVLNQDASISVIDPIVGMSGRTKLYAQVLLHRPGGDWAKGADQARLYVSMPLAHQVAVVDTESFEVIRNVDAGRSPLRVALQPDGRYLWVGNNARDGAQSGVTVIDTESLQPVASIATGPGHHEIAFGADSRHAFVSNRDAGTVSVIDIARLEKIKDIATGALPLSLAYSRLADALYVSDGKDGTVTVIDATRLEVLTRIETRPGLGPLRFSEDGRWGVAVNTAEHRALVIDSATNRIVHELAVGARPYQVSFSRSFAYVRSLDSERVSMINLAVLDKGATPPVTTFAAGASAPGKVQDLSIADAITPAAGEAAVLVVSPADATVYYYMEGMNAPMGNFLNYGHRPRAVAVVDRTLREREPGLYAAKVKIPAPGTYDIAFLLNSPRLLHCFTVTAAPNPLLERDLGPLDVEYLLEQREVTAGASVPLRFRLTDPHTGKPRADVGEVRVLYYIAPGRMRTELIATELGDGRYEAALALPRPGAYYVNVAAPAVNVGYHDLPFLTLRARRPASGSPEDAPPAHDLPAKETHP